MSSTAAYDTVGRQILSADVRGIVTSPTYYPGRPSSNHLERQGPIGKHDCGCDIHLRWRGPRRNYYRCEICFRERLLQFPRPDAGRSGEGTYPVHHVYDAYGQQIELWTWRNAVGTEADADKTLWSMTTTQGG